MASEKGGVGVRRKQEAGCIQPVGTVRGSGNVSALELLTLTCSGVAPGPAGICATAGDLWNADMKRQSVEEPQMAINLVFNLCKR